MWWQPQTTETRVVCHTTRLSVTGICVIVLQHPNEHTIDSKKFTLPIGALSIQKTEIGSNYCWRFRNAVSFLFIYFMGWKGASSTHFPNHALKINSNLRRCNTIFLKIYFALLESKWIVLIWRRVGLFHLRSI